MYKKIDVVGRLAKEYFKNIAKAVYQTDESAKFFFDKLFDSLNTGIYDIRIEHPEHYNYLKKLLKIPEGLTTKEEEDLIVQKAYAFRKDSNSGQNENTEELQKAIHTAINYSPYKYRFTSVPYFGQLPTGNLNAKILKVPKVNEYVVIFENQLYTYSMLISKLFAICLPMNEYGDLSYSHKEVFDNIVGNKVIIRRFVNLIVTHVFEENISRAEPYLLSDNIRGSVSNSINTTIELFILAHEYGHFLGGHLLDENIEKTLIKSKEVEEVKLNWDQEFEADKIGYDLTKGALIDNEWVDASITLFFGVLECLREAESIFDMKNNSEGISSHPSSIERLSNLGLLNRNHDGTRTKQLNELVLFVLQTLWNEVAPMLVSYSKDLKNTNKN